MQRTATPYIELDTVPIDPARVQVFSEQWHGHVFALMLELKKANVFDWGEWERELRRQIAADPDANKVYCNDDRYFEQRLETLIVLIDGKQLLKADEIASRQEQWRQAYLNTPHGRAVELANADGPPAHTHGHAHTHVHTHEHGHEHTPRRSPIAVSPAGG